MKNGVQAILGEREFGNLRSQVFCGVQRLCAALLRREGQQPLKLDFCPDLPNVGSAFFPWKEVIVEKTCGAIKVPGFRQIQYQFKHQGIGSVGKAWIFPQRLRALTRGISKQAEGLIDTEIDRDMRWIVREPVAKGCERVFRVIFDVEKGQADVRIEHRK